MRERVVRRTASIQLVILQPVAPVFAETFSGTESAQRFIGLTQSVEARQPGDFPVTPELSLRLAMIGHKERVAVSHALASVELACCRYGLVIGIGSEIETDEPKVMKPCNRLPVLAFRTAQGFAKQAASTMPRAFSSFRSSSSSGVSLKVGQILSSLEISKCVGSFWVLMSSCGYPAGRTCHIFQRKLSG
jgi:hypothetical protein